MTEEQKERLNIIYELGKYYGYPECCILEFISDVMDGNDPASSRGAKSVGNGFVPCAKHFVEIMKGQTAMIELIDSRCCPHEFPKDHKIK